MSQQRFKLEIDTEVKTPKKLVELKQCHISTIESFGLRDTPSPNASHRQKCEIKNEEKTEKVIRKICFDDDQSVMIKRDSTTIRLKRPNQRDNKVNSSYTLGQFNSIEIRRDNTIMNKLEKPSEADFQEMELSQRNELITCKCKKTKCSKMYCECYANGQECSFRCECTGCNNRQPKLLPLPASDYSGCFCKKQDCSKKYCECLKRNQRCTSKCKCCEDCKNYIVKFSPQPFDLNRF